MKTKLITILIGLSFIAIIGGAFLFFQASALTITANVAFSPSKVDLGAPSPKEFQVTLWFSGKYGSYNVSNIDGRTILVEGILEPKGGGKHVTIVDGKAVFQIDGPLFVDLIVWSKIYHMGIVEPNPNRPYKIPIIVTGQLYDGTLFEGSFDLRVLIPSNPGPPPPPPP